MTYKRNNHLIPMTLQRMRTRSARSSTAVTATTLNNSNSNGSSLFMLDSSISRSKVGPTCTYCFHHCINLWYVPIKAICMRPKTKICKSKIPPCWWRSVCQGWWGLRRGCSRGWPLFGVSEWPWIGYLSELPRKVFCSLVKRGSERLRLNPCLKCQNGHGYRVSQKKPSLSEFRCGKYYSG